MTSLNILENCKVPNYTTTQTVFKGITVLWRAKCLLYSPKKFCIAFVQWHSFHKRGDIYMGTKSCSAFMDILIIDTHMMNELQMENRQ